MNKRKLGQRLASLRKKLGISRAELARRSGISESTIAKIEKGEVDPFIETFLKIARGLAVPVGELLDFDND